jgi:hypothetical protein
MDAIEAAICAVMRGARGIRERIGDEAARASFLDAAARHRVRPLLSWRIRESGETAQWPEPIARALAAAERAEAALDIVRRHETRRVLAALRAADVDVLVVKGAALAWTRYPEPWLRPREDIDLLVHAADAERAAAALASAGYAAAPMQSGRIVTHQRLYVRADSSGRRHACDLHWKIADPAPFADLLASADLFAGADALTLDGTPIRVPSRAHALLLAAWHRVSHHRASRDLLWLYDLHLLADGLGDDDAARAAEILRRTRTPAIAAEGLSLAAERYGTRVPARLLAPPADRHDTPPAIAAYLRPDARKVDLLAADLRALPGWRSRARLLREHLFPPADYMRAAARGSRAPLPVLYAVRIARGARAWFRRPPSR